MIKATAEPQQRPFSCWGWRKGCGYGVYWLITRLRASDRAAWTAWLRPALAVLLAAAVIFEHMAVPLPLSDARVPAVYDQIAATPGEFSVMQVPLGWRNSFGVFGPEQTQLQYYQTGHGKPMLGGNISRAPEFKMEYFQRIPYFQALTEIEFGRPVAPEVLEAAAMQAEDLMYLYDTRYVLLFPPIPGRPPYEDTWQASWDFVKDTLPLEETPFWAQDGIEAYRVRQPAGGDQFYLNLGEAGTYPYRGEGWDAAEVDTPYEESAIWATWHAEPVSLHILLLRHRSIPEQTWLCSFAYRCSYIPGAGAERHAERRVNGQRLAPQNSGGRRLAGVLAGRCLATCSVTASPNPARTQLGVCSSLCATFGLGDQIGNHRLACNCPSTR
ncbi:MAG: hypothetical protein H6643_04275 [Caldilineaceae bacterium]|nr:hypothetical protein [Caldilineaceae bacterium]